MILAKNGLNSEQVSLVRLIYIEKMYFDAETSGLNGEGGLNFKWSKEWNFNQNKKL